MKNCVISFLFLALGPSSFVLGKYLGVSDSLFFDKVNAEGSLKFEISSGGINLDKIEPSTESGSMITVKAGKAVWEKYYIDKDITLNVPGEYTTIQDAFAYLNTKFIMSNVTVTIQVADGTYNLSSSINLYHSSGQNIEIVGNTSTPSSVVFNFSGVHGFVFENSSRIKLIDGLTIRGDDTCSCSGIYVNNNSKVNLGSSMVVEDFENGVLARYNSYISLGGTYNSNTFAGVYAVYNSAIYTRTGTVSSNNSRGFNAGSKSVITANSSSADNNTTYGYRAWLFSSIFSGSASGNGTNYYPGKDSEGSIESYIR